MTVDELKELQHLPMEIRRYDRALVALERKAKAADIPPRRRAEYEAAIDECRQVLTEAQARCVCELDRLQRFIDSIDDGFTQAVFIERYANGRSLLETTYAVDKYGIYTTETLKKQVKRYLAKRNAEAAPTPPAAAFDIHTGKEVL